MRQTKNNYGGGSGSGTYVSYDITGSFNPVVDASTFISIDGQKVYILPFVYEVGSNELLVFSGGAKMSVGIDYQEHGLYGSSSSRIDFYDPRIENEVVTVSRIRNEVVV